MYIKSIEIDPLIRKLFCFFSFRFSFFDIYLQQKGGGGRQMKPNTGKRWLVLFIGGKPRLLTTISKTVFVDLLDLFFDEMVDDWRNPQKSSPINSFGNCRFRLSLMQVFFFFTWFLAWESKHFVLIFAGLSVWFAVSCINKP